QYVGECSERSEWMVASRQIGSQRILGERDIRDQRRAYIRQSVADENAGAAGSPSQMLRLAMSAARTRKVAQRKLGSGPIADEDQLIGMYFQRREAVAPQNFAYQHGKIVADNLQLHAS